MKAALLSTTAGMPIEIWFQDEARVGQQGTLEYVWAPIGSRPAMVRDNRRDSAYLYGALKLLPVLIVCCSAMALVGTRLARRWRCQTTSRC